MRTCTKLLRPMFVFRRNTNIGTNESRKRKGSIRDGTNLRYRSGDWRCSRFGRPSTELRIFDKRPSYKDLRSS